MHSNGWGKGWHKNSKGHSDARRFGAAEKGPYLLGETAAAIDKEYKVELGSLKGISMSKADWLEDVRSKTATIFFNESKGERDYEQLKAFNNKLPELEKLIDATAQSLNFDQVYRFIAFNYDNLGKGSNNFLSVFSIVVEELESKWGRYPWYCVKNGFFMLKPQVTSGLNPNALKDYIHVAIQYEVLKGLGNAARSVFQNWFKIMAARNEYIAKQQKQALAWKARVEQLSLEAERARQLSAAREAERIKQADKAYARIKLKPTPLLNQPQAPPPIVESPLFQQPVDLMPGIVYDIRKELARGSFYSVDEQVMFRQALRLGKDSFGLQDRLDGRYILFGKMLPNGIIDAASVQPVHVDKFLLEGRMLPRIKAPAAFPSSFSATPATDITPQETEYQRMMRLRRRGRR